MAVKWIKFLIAIDKKPRRGLLAAEWFILGYLVLTLLLILFMWTKLANPAPLLWGRFHAAALMAALWVVYRLVPCRLTLLGRVLLQLAMLSWWYPDTFDLNRILPNQDHFFAAMEQQLFGCQPALLFSQRVASPVFSELMYMGYSSYYPLIAITTFYYFIRRNDEFERTAFVILAAFFAFYAIYVLLPVTGPQYYYLAAGLDNIAAGNFPAAGDYFITHDQSMHMTGYENGLFYQFMAKAHATGERPTAAFPSSHVGITLILLLLALRARSRRLSWVVGVMLLLMCMATVYIRAHYAIDVIAGLVTGTVFYLALQFAYSKLRLW